VPPALSHFSKAFGKVPVVGKPVTDTSFSISRNLFSKDLIVYI
jgi:hypothetical protein